MQRLVALGVKAVTGTAYRISRLTRGKVGIKLCLGFSEGGLIG